MMNIYEMMKTYQNEVMNIYTYKWHKVEIVSRSTFILVICQT